MWNCFLMYLNSIMLPWSCQLKETFPFGLCKALLDQAGGDTHSHVWQLAVITCEFSTRGFFFSEKSVLQF